MLTNLTNFPTGPYPGVLTNGMVELTSSNGDKIYFQITGTFLATKTNGVWINRLHFINGCITGGTGKFEGAYGYVNGDATQSCGTGLFPNGDNVPTSFWFSGEIHY